MKHVVITMAGEGSRFRKAGFNQSKHLIEVKGRTLLEWSLSSLENFFDWHFIFVMRKARDEVSVVHDHAARVGIKDLSIVELDYLTEGQASTALEAKPAIKNSADEFFIYNIDTCVESHALKPEDIKGDGWVPAFRADGDKWSFVKFDDQFKVSSVTEKIRISEYGSIGLYYFSSFSLYEECYQKYNFEGCKEKFVAPLYNAIIEKPGADVYTTILDEQAVHVLGTPEDVQIFLNSACPTMRDSSV